MPREFRAVGCAGGSCPGTRTQVRLGRWFAVGLALCAALACSPDSKERVQGIIVLSFDALRADVLGSYGHPRVTSPTSRQ